MPEDLLYDVEPNVWVRVDGDSVVMGMTDIGQTMCGRFVQISWKSPGRTIPRGRSLAVIESAKWVGPFPAAVSGELVANNESAFGADIAVANRDPYGEGWLSGSAPPTSPPSGRTSSTGPRRWCAIAGSSTTTRCAATGARTDRVPARSRWPASWFPSACERDNMSEEDAEGAG